MSLKSIQHRQAQLLVMQLTKLSDVCTFGSRNAQVLNTDISTLHVYTMAVNTDLASMTDGCAIPAIICAGSTVHDTAGTYHAVHPLTHHIHVPQRNQLLYALDLGLTHSFQVVQRSQVCSVQSRLQANLGRAGVVDHRIQS